jgi:hypothetical protein
MKAALLLLGCVLVILGGCDRRESGTLSPEQAAEARRQIVLWLECEECTSGELDAVVKLGQAAVPSLAATLKDGPSNARKARMEQYLNETHERYDEYWKTHTEDWPNPNDPTVGAPATKDVFVQGFLRNYEARYRMRAARALGEIGGDEARKALEEAAQDQRLRYDERNAVTEALQKLSGAPAARTAA